MASILTPCPNTGRAIPTGLRTEWVVFDSLPRIPIPIRCTACGKRHTWTSLTAWVDGQETTTIAAEYAASGNQPWRIVMKKTMLLASAAMIGVSFLAVPAKAQGGPQAVEITKVDVQKVAAGYRASKVIGSSVLNDANQTIGKIDDLLVTRDGKEPYAVLSVGGFLGMGIRMVVIRYDSLKFADNKIVLPGGTKDGLKMLPAFQYSKD